MKKYFYLAAVSAMMLTACSSDKDVLEPTPTPSTPTVAAQQQAVAFDTYLAGTTASTRAGEEGVMTTQKLKEATAGFGVFAYYQDHVDYADGALTPDFMYNQKVIWNAGWGYSPLKYWPNETLTDSQTDPATSPTVAKPDKLSFFAYAPYVDETTTGATVGITGFTPANNATGDPKVTFAINTDPDHNVDLLWGVAPAGFSYTDVSSGTTSVPVGMPLKDLVKPDKDQKVKFLFQHALSRIGLSVVSAIDQIAAGDDAGTFTSDPTTKVLIKSVTVTGKFGQTGDLNLNNIKSNEANWENVAKSTDVVFTINSNLAPNLSYNADQIKAVTGDATAVPPVTADSYQFVNINAGVLPSEQPLLAGGLDLSKKVNAPAFAYGKVYLDNTGAVVSTTASDACDAYVKVGNNYEQVFATGTPTNAPLNGYSKKLYKLTGSALAADATLTANTKYFKKEGIAGKLIFKEITGDGSTTGIADTYYAADALTELSGANYTGEVYEAQPRYFMVIPTGATDITVNIKYAVVTKDTKLNGNLSNVENDITKKVSVNLENGKSYNLKLILGLTSVKLDATVADWKVADETEFFLPQNNE